MPRVGRSRRRADVARVGDAQELAVPPSAVARSKRVARAPGRVIRDFFEGVRLYWRGFRTWSKDPKLMLLGIIPGLITWAIFIALFAGMWLWLDDLARWTGDKVTSNDELSALVAAAVAFAVIAGALLLLVYAFVSIASVVGQPFFEALSHSVDDRYGSVPDGPGWPWWRNAIRGVSEGLRLFMVQAPISISIFFIGLIPVVGTVTAWTLGALVGGWFVALEMTSIPFERRGLILKDRRRALGARRARTLGFGTMAFLMAIVPPLAAATMPAGVAAGTILARRSLGESAELPQPASVEPAG
jgi:CysZ protein